MKKRRITKTKIEKQKTSQCTYAKLSLFQRNLNPNDACTAVIDNIHHKDQILALCRVLERCGFSGMAKALIIDTDSLDERDTIDHISGKHENI